MNDLDIVKDKILDKEWEELILLALNAGMTVEEIKEFFSQSSKSR
ncbi:anti-repressor SinI family protein [Metabacillus fastidiosus]|uniref:Anti-repressor SinI family protein n=1 Tax=Metabacillus fastidiosus TaxID=1458 RepID=A0ABU6NZH7_9BACI|nr:anti-repressor SinI family protein [Metabacillus fastidiosus]MED4402532.1 anti-repressor SinI family protein [Metabacillus fastidiosus]MED4455523.1 anti-repressor SinI family protein [Metabacillus fastidiosus]MED4461890.1 anti-repressor SinI family protein [Metabacillus fastidiosus]